MWNRVHEECKSRVLFATQDETSEEGTDLTLNIELHEQVVQFSLMGRMVRVAGTTDITTQERRERETTLTSTLN